MGSRTAGARCKGLKVVTGQSQSQGWAMGLYRGRIEVQGSSTGFAKREISAEFAKRGYSTKVVKQDFRQDLQSSGSTRESQSGKMEWESQAGDQRGNLRAEF